MSNAYSFINKEIRLPALVTSRYYIEQIKIYVLAVILKAMLVTSILK